MTFQKWRDNATGICPVIRWPGTALCLPFKTWRVIHGPTIVDKSARVSAQDGTRQRDKAAAGSNRPMGSTLPGNLKAALSGTHHAFKFAKSALRYLAEVRYRCNRGALWARSTSRASRSPPRPCSVQSGRPARLLGVKWRDWVIGFVVCRRGRSSCCRQVGALTSGVAKRPRTGKQEREWALRLGWTACAERCISD
ncbi:MAG: family transposase [Massilia sp.]|nr:family transposase [Massilia sp.]